MTLVRQDEAEFLLVLDSFFYGAPFVFKLIFYTYLYIYCNYIYCNICNLTALFVYSLHHLYNIYYIDHVISILTVTFIISTMLFIILTAINDASDLRLFETNGVVLDLYIYISTATFIYLL